MFQYFFQSFFQSFLRSSFSSIFISISSSISRDPLSVFFCLFWSALVSMDAPFGVCLGVCFGVSSDHPFQANSQTCPIFLICSLKIESEHHYSSEFIFRKRNGSGFVLSVLSVLSSFQKVFLKSKNRYISFHLYPFFFWGDFLKYWHDWQNWQKE